MTQRRHHAGFRTGDDQRLDVLRSARHLDAALNGGVDGADLAFEADADQPRSDFAIANAGHACGFTGGVYGLNGGDQPSRFNYA